MIKVESKKDCTGCEACKSICPKNCIEMAPDEEGFLYPRVDHENCIDCGLCEKVCPILHSNDKTCQGRQKAYIVQHKCDKIRMESTSGGAFSAIAEYALGQGGAVFGAAFDTGFQIRHQMVNGSEELSKLRGSKYVQSQIGSAFQDAKEILESGRLVVFSGTPCQIEGLSSFLGKRYDNLVLVDLVCHAVSSPLAWKKFLDCLPAGALKEGSWIKFRDKSKYGYEYTQLTVYRSNGTEVYRSGPESDPMLRAFVSNTCTRPSCYECHFKKRHRISDFTIWDCYNVYQYNQAMDDNKGTSHVLIHSEKGQEIFGKISGTLRFMEVDCDQAIASEPALTQSSKPGSMREPFMKDLPVLDGRELFARYFPDRLTVKTERLLRKILSRLGGYRGLKRLVKGVRGRE